MTWLREPRLAGTSSLLSVSVLCLLLTACARQPLTPPGDAAHMPVTAYLEEHGLADDRGRYREILCAVLEHHGDSIPDYRPCEEALTWEGEEAGATGEPVSLGRAGQDFLILTVPGLGWECFEEWLDYSGAGPRHLARYGYDMRVLSVDSLSSSEHNARQIRDFIINLPEADAGRPLVLMGYSKGAPDILTALVEYPELQQRVKAVVSLAGAVGGSPLANEASQSQANLLIHVPGSECDKGDNGAVDSLKTDLRRQWLAEHPLPDSIQYFSVVTYPDPDRVSWGLRNSYRVLAGVDTRNDTQVLIYDQIIPGSTLLAFVNADHWAIAVPVARTHPFVGSTFVNHNDYPREAALEALVRYLEEAVVW